MRSRLLCAVAVIACFPALAWGQGALTNGAMHTGTISVAGETDTWTFSATAGDAIVMSVGEVVSGATLSPWIRVFSPSSTLVASASGNQAAQVSATATVTGTYTVLIADFNATGTGDYRLTLARSSGVLTVSAGDEGGPMTNGTSHGGTLPLGDLDAWSFTAQAGDAIALSTGEVVSGASLAPWLRLFSPTGVLLGTGSGNQAIQVTATATVTGTYLVVVSDFNNSGTGDYRLTLAKTGDPLVISAGDEGGPMTNGVSHGGTLTTGDLDAWSFTAQAGDAIALSTGEVVSGASLAPWLRLFSPTGVLLGTGSGNQATQMTATATVTGTYLVLISDFNDSGTGDYRLTLAKVPGPFIVSAGDEGGPMITGVSHSGTLPTGDLDLWSFTAQAGDPVVVSVGEVVSGASLAPWLRLFSPTGALLDTASGNATAQVSVTAAATGTYTVVVSDFNNTGSGDYGLTVTGNTNNLVRNGGFSSGLTNWSLFEVPDIVHNSAANGVFEYYKANPTTTASGQAVIFQNTGQPVLSGASLAAQFDIGNSDPVRKRISVLIIDADFSDLSVCTFYLAPSVPLRTYQMRTHSTKAWTNASIYFYAASGGTSGGRYLLDNVSLQYDPTGSVTRTDCVDPTAPTPPGGAAGPTLLANGDFGTGTLTPWGLFGDLTSQIVGGVFEFIRPGTPGQPAGVILQNTGAAMSVNQILTASFDLGNSSTVRKRVTVLLHDGDFSDLTACTFWLPPGQALSTYTMRSFATKAWANATISVYAATTGPEQWMRLDNVTLQRTPGTAALGTECLEPGGGSAAFPVTEPDGIHTDATGRGGFVSSADASVDGSAPGWQAEAWATGRAILAWANAIDLTQATSARLTFASWLSDGASSGHVQVSVDGVTWETVATVARTGAWTTTDVDLGAFAGHVAYVRFVFDGVAPGIGAMPDVWRIRDVVVHSGDLKRGG